jgi:hypothetical protein
MSMPGELSRNEERLLRVVLSRGHDGQSDTLSLDDLKRIEQINEQQFVEHTEADNTGDYRVDSEALHLLPEVTQVADPGTILPKTVRIFS